MPVKAHWEHFEHTADMGVRGFGPTRGAAFEQVAAALCALVADPATVAPATPVDIRIDGADPELLLLDWLNALVCEMATRHMVFSRFQAGFDAKGLSARAWGERVDPRRLAPGVEVKGATATELRVARCEDGWMAQCVVDV